MADPIPLVLKFEDWPRADKAAWDSLFTPGDIFDGQGPCANWSDGTRTKRRQSYGQWLSFVVRTDPAGLDELPSERITPNRVRAYLEECEARLQPSSTAGLVTDLYVVANSVAPDWNWAWLETASRRLAAQADRCALPAPHPVSAGKIFSWALTRMESAEADASLTAMRRAIWFRQALLIGFLISRPVRRRALLAMCIGRHIQPVCASSGRTCGRVSRHASKLAAVMSSARASCGRNVHAGRGTCSPACSNAASAAADTASLARRILAAPAPATKAPAATA